MHFVSVSFIDNHYTMFDLPDNVIYLINEYSATRFSQSLLSDILHIQSDNALKYFEKNIVSSWYELRTTAIEHNYISFDEFIHITLQKHEIEYFVDCFKHCECCHRHSFSGLVRKDKKPESSVFICEYSNKKCTCSCRHHRRRLQNILEYY